MPFYQFEEISPQLAAPETSWVAPCATLIGNVRVGAKTSVWFGAILRGDNEAITIGEGANVQENVVMHTDPGYPLTVGKGCTIGHKAMLHGCQIGENSLSGMGATLLNGAVIGKNSLVGADTLVAENKSFPEGSLIVGVPAKLVRQLTDEEMARLQKSAQTYMDKIPRYQAGLQAINL